MSQPKRKRPKSKKINISSREKWEKILKEVQKEIIPISLLESVTVNLIDGTSVNIDIKELLNEGVDPDEIEKSLEDRLKMLDFVIRDVDFFVSVDDLAKVVQPITDGFLKDL